MPLTPEERRTYEELKARLDKEQRTIPRIIRHWIVTIVVVIVVGIAVDAVSSREGKERFQWLDEQLLKSLKQVSIGHIFNVYVGYVLPRPPTLSPSFVWDCPPGVHLPDPRCGFRVRKWESESNPWDLVPFPYRPLLGLIFTGLTVATEGWLNIVLLGFAALLSVIAARIISYQHAKARGLLWFFGVPAMTLGFLSILFLFAKLVGIVFDGLVQLLIVASSGGFIGTLLLRVTEHHFSAKAIRKLAKEAG